MLKIIADETKISEKRTELLVIGCFLNEDYSDLLNKFDEEISIAGKEIISHIHKFGLLNELYTFAKLPARKILFAGLGASCMLKSPGDTVTLPFLFTNFCVDCVEVLTL